MRLLWVGFSLSLFLGQIPTQAATIINVQEEAAFTWREPLSDCEWLDHFEVRTTTTYQQITASFSSVVAYSEPSEVVTKQWNPCAPEYADSNGNLPAYCPTEPLLPPKPEPVTLGVMLTSLYAFDPIVSEWAEVEITDNVMYQNECDDCDPGTTTPEPHSWVLSVTGLIVLVFLRYRSH